MNDTVAPTELAAEQEPAQERRGLCGHCNDGGDKRWMCENCYAALNLIREVEEEAAKKARYKAMIERWRR